MRPQRDHYSHLVSTRESTPSDGYGTGFAVYILRQAGVSVTHPQIVKGVYWLLRNQRLSGLWFTPSPDAGVKSEAVGNNAVGTRELNIMSMGTAFAVLALKSCETGDGTWHVWVRPRPHHLPGLALRTGME